MCCIIDRSRTRLAGPLVLIATLLLIVVIDRALLAYYGLPPWEADPVLHYRNRPNERRMLPAHLGGKPLRTNQFGFYDDDFPRAKPAGEFRALAIGDSVMMGHGVTPAEALPNQLEALLRQRQAASPVPFRSYQVINAGVQGYWTDQYVEVLRRSLDLAPNLVIVGFCLNDVIDFYAFDRAHGGRGLDFHGVQQTSSPLLSYLVNATGFGRLAIAMRSRMPVDPALLRPDGRGRRYGVRRVIRHSHDDPEVVEAWRHALDNLATIYRIARAQQIPVVLVIFPFDYQLGRPELQEPQRILARHADSLGVPHLDATSLFEAALAQGTTARDLFLDMDHFQVRGHHLLAESLHAFLEARDLIRPAGAPAH